MQVTSTKIESALILGLQGELTAAQGASALHEQVRGFDQLDVSHVVLDLDCLRRLDCMGVGDLMRLHAEVASCGGTTVLANVTDHNRQLLEMLQLHKVFPVFDTVEEALRCCRSQQRSIPASTAEPAETSPPPRIGRGGRLLNWSSHRRNGNGDDAALRVRPAIVGAVLSVLLLSTTILADNVYLKNGRVIPNVETRIEGDKLVVMQDGMELTLPLGMVDHIEEAETNPVVRSRPSTASATGGSGSGRNNAAVDVSTIAKKNRSGVRSGTAASPSVSNRTPKIGEVIAGRGGRVRYNNGVDVISFNVPSGIWVVYGETEEEGEEGDGWDLIEPSNLLKDRSKWVDYAFVIWPHRFDPSEGRSTNRQVSWWMGRAQTALLTLPTRVRKHSKKKSLRIDGDLYSTLCFWHEWSSPDYLMDGVFLLYFPEDYVKRNRYYVFLWAVTHSPRARGVDLDLPSFETVVESFRVETLG